MRRCESLQAKVALRGIRALSVALLLSTAGPAHAERELESASAVFPESDAARTAETHYRRALALFDAGKFSEALLEFESANRAAPNYRLHYNIAITRMRLGNPSRAIEEFEVYLKEGGAEIPAERVSAVQSELTRLQTQVARLTIRAECDGSVISVNGEAIGVTPLASEVRLDPGPYTITCSSPLASDAREIEARAGESLIVSFSQAQPKTVAAPPKAAPRARVATEPKPQETRAVPWVPWAITGALAGATATFGILTLNARSDELAVRERSRVSRLQYEDARARVENLALATDVLAGLTVVSGALSLYFTLRPAESERSPAIRVGLRPVANGIQVDGAF